MLRKLFTSLTLAIAFIFGASLVAPSSSLAEKRGNPSDCAKIRNIDEKMECHEKALEELKAEKKDRKKDHDKDDDKDDDKDKKKKDKKDKKSKKDKKEKKKKDKKDKKKK
ncbi:MAG: hypothetical protein O3A85_05325 [Proteobacteria bacterium]|nr:hypothetical protein [Pseudomonadota bacterium]